VGGLLAGGILGGILKMIGVMVSPADVKREAIKVNFPAVLEWKKKGWEFGAKPSGVS
jgi:hypothetical protein